MDARTKRAMVLFPFVMPKSLGPTYFTGVLTKNITKTKKTKCKIHIGDWGRCGVYSLAVGSDGLIIPRPACSLSCKPVAVLGCSG